MLNSDGYSRQPSGYIFVAFFTLPFLLFNIGPIFFGIYVAFTEWNIIGTPDWVGFENFERVFSDTWAWKAFANALFYVLIIVPSVSILGLGFALFVSRGYPLAGVARTLIFAPHVVSSTVIGLVWVWMLDTQFGLVNLLLGKIGIQPIPWLTSPSYSLFGISIASIWWDLGLAFILLLAALQDIPKDLIEVARVDGVKAWQRLRYIVLPLIQPTISLVLTLQIIATMRIFSTIYVMTSGGPAGSSSSPIFYIYSMATDRGDYGYASAIAILLFLVILAIAIFVRLVLRERTW